MADSALSQQVPGYHSTTRWLHAGLVLGVLFQLICTLWMAHPDHQDGGHHGGAVMVQPAHDDHAASSLSAVAHQEHSQRSWRQWLMAAHRMVGVLVALIVVANLIWALQLRGDPPHRQIGVLFSGDRWRESAEILMRLPSMLLGKRPLAAPGNALSLVVEMLGLLIMGAMALTGVVIWSLWSGPGGEVSAAAEMVMNIHSFFASLLMIYLAGHVSMALIHARSGDRVFARISPFGKYP